MDGTTKRCRLCRNKHAQEYYETHREQQSTRKRQDRIERPIQNLLFLAKQRAKRLGVEFDITVDQIDKPEFCPILGYKLVYGENTKIANDSATLDRWNNSVGYVPGNVYVISQRANQLKSDMTFSEAEALLQYMQSPPESIGITEQRKERPLRIRDLSLSDLGLE
jgi:hypothetical protein